MPRGNGLLLDYIHAYASAAICEGTMRYCQYENKVEEGMWAGGKVGLKSILRAKSSEDALNRLQRLSHYGFLTYRYSPKTKYLSYIIGEEYRVKNTKEDLPVRGKNTYGFVRVPRNIAEKLIAKDYVFSEADRNGLPKVHIHSLRHTNASILIANGVDIKTVSKRLGHSNIQTTGNIYTHQIRSADELASETIDLVLGSKKTIETDKEE
jgi:hypothetical protein